MPSLRGVVLCLAAATLLSSGSTAQRTPPRIHQRSASSEISQDAIPTEESLHRALKQAAPAFQDGVFESPRAAVSALTDADPALARQVIEAARFDLFRRQTVSNSSTSTSSTITTSFDPSSTSFSTTLSSSVSSSSSSSTSSAQSTSSSSTSESSDSSSTTASPSSTATPSVSSDTISSVPTPSSTSSLDSNIPGSSSPLSATAFSSASSVVLSGSSTGSVSSASLASTVTFSTSAPFGSETSSNTYSPTVSSTPSADTSSTLLTPSSSSTPSITSFVPADPTTSSSSSESSSSGTDVYIPVPITSVDNGVTQISTALSARPVTASVTVPVTTTNAQGQIVTTDTVLPALVYTSTDAQGRTFLVTDLLPGSDPTPTDDSNPTSQADATPRPVIASGAVRSVITQTTVIGGEPTLVTKTIVVLPTDAPGIAAQPLEATNTDLMGATPSLQAGAATGMRSAGKEIVALVGAAVGVAILI